MCDQARFDRADVVRMQRMMMLARLDHLARVARFGIFEQVDTHAVFQQPRAAEIKVRPLHSAKPQDALVKGDALLDALRHQGDVVQRGPGQGRGHVSSEKSGR